MWRFWTIWIFLVKLGRFCGWEATLWSRNTNASPKKLSYGHLLTIEWLVIDVTAVGTPSKTSLRSRNHILTLRINKHRVVGGQSYRKNIANYYFLLKLVIRKEVNGEQREDKEACEVSSYLTMTTTIENCWFRRLFLCVGGKWWLVQKPITPSINSVDQRWPGVQ